MIGGRKTLLLLFLMHRLLSTAETFCALLRIFFHFGQYCRNFETLIIG
jgi:hypothetical protein